jgi:glycosyltransferase involved in cell wall biosynthesis
MRLAFISAQDPRYNVQYFSGIPYHLFRALARQIEVIPVLVSLDSPSLWYKGRAWIERRLLSRNYAWGLRRDVLKRLALQSAGALIGSEANVALTIGQGHLVFWESPIPAASFSDVLYGSVPGLQDRPGSRYPLSQAQERTLIRLGQQAVENALRVFITSEYALEGAVENLGTRIQSPKAVVTQIGANLEGIPEKLETRASPPPLRLLWVGTKWQLKGGPDCLEVLSGLQQLGLEVELHLVGQAPSNLREQNVIYHGYLRKDVEAEHQRLMDLYSQSHLLLYPTRGDFTPSVLAEAAALGVPAVTTPVGGISGMFRPNEMLLLDRSAFGSRAPRVILKLLESGSLSEMAKRVRRRYETHLNWDAIAEKILGELEDALDTGRHG